MEYDDEYSAYSAYSQEGGTMDPVYFAGNYFYNPGEVQAYFGPKDEGLAYKYFKNPWTVENLRIEQGDKKKVLQFINSKIQGLTTKDRLGHTIKDRGILLNARPLGIVEELTLMKRMLEDPTKQPLTEEEQSNAEILEKIEDLSAKRMFSILYENAWWLLHPTDIPKEVRDSWLAILEQNKQSELDVLLRLMDKKKSPENQLKTFMDLDIADPIGKEGESMKSAAAITAASMGKGPREFQAKLQERLRQAFEVFSTLGFISKMRINDILAHPDTLDSALKEFPKEIAAKLLRSMDPIYKFYKTQYGAAYTLIESFMTNKFTGFGQTGSRTPISFPIDAILTFLNQSNEIRQLKTFPDEGLVRLTGVSINSIREMIKLLKKFTEYMNTKTRDYKNAGIPTADSPSSQLYNLMAGTDTTTIQFINPSVRISPSDFKKALGAKAQKEKQDLEATATKFFEKSSETIYLMIQPRSTTTKPKDLEEIKPVLMEFPETANKASLTTFSSLALTHTFSSLSIVTPHTEFVRSITDRSAALMVVLYFRLMMERASKIDVANPKSILKTENPVGDAATAEATTATAATTAATEATATTAATTTTAAATAAATAATAKGTAKGTATSTGPNPESVPPKSKV